MSVAASTALPEVETCRDTVETDGFPGKMKLLTAQHVNGMDNAIADGNEQHTGTIALGPDAGNILCGVPVTTWWAGAFASQTRRRYE